MDWFLDSGDLGAFSELRAEFRDYARRHAAPGSDVHGAELAFSEVVTNAVKHAGGPVWVSLEWTEERPRLTVKDLGPGFEVAEITPPDVASTRGRGLLIASHMTEELEVARRRAGGAQVSARLPLTRLQEETPAVPVLRHGSLPLAQEARPDGTFGRESFLRALVVQLAQALERDEGPAAAASAVAQVGMDVGGRMEEEYRRAEDLTGRLTPQQMGDLYVRLKHAIEGDFYVEEATEDRIVLGNRRCPFGDVVTRAPALCRMTSSVFGGIAARNRGASAVELEERIAVGDPGCRVVVWLGEAAEGAPASTHFYGEPVEPQTSTA